MAETVWKFAIPPSGGTMRFILDLPEGASPIHFDCVDEALWLWVKLDPSRRTVETHQFALYGTGVMILNPGVHIGTVIIPQINEVYHLFEEA